MKKKSILLILFSVFILSCDKETEKENVLPECAINYPISNQIIQTGEIVLISVSVNDIDGTINEVEFYVENNLHSISSNSPYTFKWNTSDNSTGEYLLRVVAYDDKKEISQDSVLVSLIDNSNNPIDNLSSCEINGDTVGYIIDGRDKQVYNIKKYGQQWWMVENLNYKSDEGSWVYNDNIDNSHIYGRLYNWKTAKESCPSCWHLPTYEEWIQLENYLISKGYSLGQNSQGKLIGNSMASTTGWRESQSETNVGYQKNNNASGFSAFPSGARSSSGNFSNKGEISYFWSSEFSSSESWKFGLTYANGTLHRSHPSKSLGYSVRCVRD